MESLKRKEHWEKIYKTKNPEEVSWYQSTPKTSLDFIKETHLPKDAKIIDIGGGDSHLVDHLLEMGYTDLSVLDIAAPSLERAVKRLGKNAEKIKWIIADVTTFQPVEKYDLWHDRAVFHFLTDTAEIENYRQTVKDNLTANGHLIIGTFSKEGPAKCSGIDIAQYDEESLNNVFGESFQLKKCIQEDHITPNNSKQNFIFCRFDKDSKEELDIV